MLFSTVGKYCNISFYFTDLNSVSFLWIKSCLEVSLAVSLAVKPQFSRGLIDFILDKQSEQF